MFYLFGFVSVCTVEPERWKTSHQFLATCRQQQRRERLHPEQKSTPAPSKVVTSFFSILKGATFCITLLPAATPHLIPNSQSWKVSIGQYVETSFHYSNFSVLVLFSQNVNVLGSEIGKPSPQHPRF